MESTIPVTDNESPALAVPFIGVRPLERTAKRIPRAPSIKDAPQQINTSEQIPITREAVAKGEEAAGGGAAC